MRTISKNTKHIILKGFFLIEEFLTFSQSISDGILALDIVHEFSLPIDKE